MLTRVREILQIISLRRRKMNKPKMTFKQKIRSRAYAIWDSIGDKYGFHGFKLRTEHKPPFLRNKSITAPKKNVKK